MISSGTLAIGHGGQGDRSVGGASPVMDRLEKSASSACSEGERSCREWWAVFGTVADAFEGFGPCGFVDDVEPAAAAAVVCSCG